MCRLSPVKQWLLSIQRTSHFSGFSIRILEIHSYNFIVVLHSSIPGLSLIQWVIRTDSATWRAIRTLRPEKVYMFTSITRREQFVFHAHATDQTLNRQILMTVGYEFFPWRPRYKSVNQTPCLQSIKIHQYHLCWLIQCFRDEKLVLLTIRAWNFAEDEALGDLHRTKDQRLGIFLCLL